MVLAFLFPKDFGCIFIPFLVRFNEQNQPTFITFTILNKMSVRLNEKMVFEKKLLEITDEFDSHFTIFHGAFSVLSLGGVRCGVICNSQNYYLPIGAE